MSPAAREGGEEVAGRARNGEKVRSAFLRRAGWVGLGGS